VINIRIEISKENRRLIELEKYFIKLIDLVEEPAIKQKESLLAFTAKLKNRIDQHYTLSYVTTFRVDLIKEIENRDLYEIFIMRKKGDIKVKTDLFQQIRGQIDYLDEVKKSLRSSFEDFMNRSEKYDAIYKENIAITNDAFANMIVQNGLNEVHPEQDILLRELDKIRALWVRSGTIERPFQDRYLARVHYLDPVRQLCTLNPTDPRATFILKHILECIHAFDNMEEIKYVYRRHFLIDARGIQKALFEIRKALSLYSKMPK
jgi:hypothetical protein